jgi:hypothetical protein
MTTNTINAAAEAAHEVNRTYCLTLGDDSQKPWKDAPSWQRDSAISGVMAIINNPSMSSKDQHSAWMLIA